MRARSALAVRASPRSVRPSCSAAAFCSGVNTRRDRWIAAFDARMTTSDAPYRAFREARSARILCARPLQQPALGREVNATFSREARMRSSDWFANR